MEIHLTFRHTTPSEAIKMHVEEKIGKLSKYLIKPHAVHVILTVERSRHVAEITCSENHELYTAKEKTNNMYLSIDGAIAKLQHQLVKSKEKIKNHKKKKLLQ